MFNNFYGDPNYWFYYQNYGMGYYGYYPPMQEIVVNPYYYPQYAAAYQQPQQPPQPQMMGYYPPQQSQQPVQYQQQPVPPQVQPQMQPQPQVQPQVSYQAQPAPAPKQFAYEPKNDIVDNSVYNGTQPVPPQPNAVGNNRQYVVATGQNVKNGVYTDDRYQGYENTKQTEEAFQRAMCNTPESELANANVRHEDRIRPQDRIKFFYIHNVKILGVIQRFWSYLIPCMNHANKFSRNILDPLLFGALDRLVIQVIKANEEEKLAKAIQLWCNCFYTLIHIEELITIVFNSNCITKNDKKKQIAHFLFQIHAMLIHIISTKQEIFARKNGISLDPNKMVKQETTNTISDENRAKVQLIEVAYKDPKWLSEHRQEIIDSYMNAN